MKWDMNKRLSDFDIVIKNSRSEKQNSRADIIEYLIERCRWNELKLSILREKVNKYEQSN